MQTHRRDDGVTVVEHEGEQMTIFIPSRKRAPVVVEHPLFPIANVVVHENEKDDYEAYFQSHDQHPGSLLTHNTSGLPCIRNQMMQYMHPQEEIATIQSDDDVRTIRFSYSHRVIAYNSAEPIMNILVAEAIAAADVPTGLFFFQQSPRPQERSALEPFVLRRWGRADVLGILDPELRFDEMLWDCEDLDISLQCIQKYHVLWMDMRYFVMTATGRGGNLVGGSAGVSTKQTIKESYERLQHKWSDYVIRIGEGKQRGEGYGVAVHIPQRSDELRSEVARSKRLLGKQMPSKW